MINPLIATLKLHSIGTSYSNTVIATLAVDGWTVTFGTGRRGLTIFISLQKVLLAPAGPLRRESALSLAFTVVFWWTAAAGPRMYLEQLTCQSTRQGSQLHRIHKTTENMYVSDGLRRIVTFLIIPPYKYSYLLTVIYYQQQLADLALRKLKLLNMTMFCKLDNDVSRVHASCLSTQQDKRRGMNDCRELLRFPSPTRPVHITYRISQHQQPSNAAASLTFCHQFSHLTTSNISLTITKPKTTVNVTDFQV